jgi:polyphosphate kinase
MQHLFDLGMSDATASWHLEADGIWRRHQFDADGKKLNDMQDQLMVEMLARKGAKA